MSNWVSKRSCAASTCRAAGGCPPLSTARRRLALATTAVCLALLWITPAAAHHSFAAFDNERTLELSGSVKDWQWANPHVWLSLTVNASGIEEEWTIEGPSPEVLRRQQVRRGVVKPGDTVTVSIHPRRDGARGGSLVAFLKVDDVESTRQH
jgi:hypothetical protein